jgi:hypothetical protein
LPLVSRLHQTFKDEGLAVLLVNFREPPHLVRRAVAERGYTAPVLLDESGEVTGLKYGVWGPPTAYLIDRQGRLRARGVGPHDWSTPAARRLIVDLLAAGAAPATPQRPR